MYTSEFLQNVSIKRTLQSQKIELSLLNIQFLLNVHF